MDKYFWYNRDMDGRAGRGIKEKVDGVINNQSDSGWI